MTSVNTSGAATAVKTILEGLSGMTSVQIGAPEAIGPTVSAWLTMGSANDVRKTTGTTQRQQRIFIVFCYRVQGSGEVTAETTLMGLVDAFFAAVNADKSLGGAVDSAEVSSLAADEPEYQLRAGLEYREYPMVVVYTQQGAYEVNP